MLVIQKLSDTPDASPLEQLEAAALRSPTGWAVYRRPSGAELHVFARRDGSFQYEWGNAVIGRAEATTRTTPRGY